MRRLLAPLAEADRYVVVGVIGGLFLLTVYLYQGHHSFYTSHVASSPARDSGYAEWYAHSYQFLAAFVFMLVVPGLWVRFGTKERLADHGLALGDWRFGLKFLLVAMVVLIAPLYLTASQPEFQAEYPLAKMAGRTVWLFLLWELCYLVYYVAWEFFFRGFWQLGLSRSLGVMGAMALQTAVSTIMHIGKPEGETMAAIVAGPVFGLVAIRTRSVLYVILLHWYVGTMTDLFCLLQSGS
ncbi:type II CAAX prenyl endopeptidase Rce1 family protein [Planctomycetota bacterium]